ncbi:uncharacterized protein PV06_02908 [Exophiala oligosperma]|uniref:Cyclase n=1 Tax=Exophiala oligosperma TaxID=215243 RepID=A0A0D2C3U8_9EURO|nr:uncharacterized protein PV06_02908 [Exophiala oligosperma]KIW44437.1 hypothetical protein PV06_02908 [Exophiala oligosperma]
MATQAQPRIPQFKDLPVDASHPPHSAWIWGPDDQLGTLNFLTKSAVLQGASEMKIGERIGLDWSLNLSNVPADFRQGLKHEIFQIGPNVNDDVLELNTQSSSQWDGFRHWAFSDGRHYNGLEQSELERGGSTRNGIHEWCRKGIVGRGVLIDFVEYANLHDIEYDATAHYAITLEQIKEIAQECDIQFHHGDILIIRTGYTESLGSMSESDLTAVKERSSPWAASYPGVENTLEMLGWLWDNRFAAVAGDAPGFEAFPPTKFRMHETLLSGFGMPIGELLYLPMLAKVCQRERRWTFFFTSQPLNVVGTVASPPNALAIL